MIKVAPSLLAADYLRIGDDIRRMAEAAGLTVTRLKRVAEGGLSYPTKIYNKKIYNQILQIETQSETV